MKKKISKPAPTRAKQVCVWRGGQGRPCVFDMRQVAAGNVSEYAETREQMRTAGRTTLRNAICGPGWGTFSRLAQFFLCQRRVSPNLTGLVAAQGWVTVDCADLNVTGRYWSCHHLPGTAPLKARRIGELTIA